jgi:hypothetical protein
VSGPVFIVCAPELIFGGTVCVGSLFHVLHSRTHFRRYRGRRVPLSFFSSLTRFHRYRGTRIPYSSFLLPDYFSAEPRTSGAVFMFCAPELIFRGTLGVGSLFNVLRSRTHFQRYRGRQVPFSCFALPDSYSAVPSASGPVFMFRGPKHIFGGTVGVGSLFHVLCSRTHFPRYLGRRVPFLCLAHFESFLRFALPNTFSMVTWASGPFSCFALPNTFSALPRASGPVFMFSAPGLIYGGFEGVRCSFHVLHSRTRFRRYRGRQVPFYVCDDSLK